jgi:predicted dehydrogenase
MGKHHCKAIQTAKGAALAAICDSDEERLHEGMNAFGCKGYTDFSELLKDEAVDCINICTESGTHADLGIAAARAGKHIVVEKPVDVTPAPIKKLQQAVKVAGVKAGCIFQSRMDPCNIRIRKAIEAGKMGRVIGVHGWLPWYRADSYYEGPHGAWKGTWKLDGGGSLMNQGVHTVDLFQWLAGPVHSVCGFAGVFCHDIEAEDQTVAILKYENGALGTLFTSTCCIPDKEQRIYVCGAKGSFMKVGGALDFYEMGPPADRKKMMQWYGVRKSGEGVSRDPMAVAADGHMLIVEDMVKAIRQDREPAISLKSATHAVEIVCAIFKSARSGREVKISEVSK